MQINGNDRFKTVKLEVSNELYTFPQLEFSPAWIKYVKLYLLTSRQQVRSKFAGSVQQSHRWK